MIDPRRGVFYGWWMVAASFAVLFISVGIGLYAPPVFMVPLQEHFGWSRAAISGGFAVAALMSGALSPLVGALIDRYGVRRVMALGALVMGSAFALLGRMGALWQLYGINMLVAGGLTCVAWIPNQTLVSNWFERKRGLAMGIALTGIGFGGLASAFLANLLIERVGWRLAYVGLASLIVVVIVPLALLVVRGGPAELGLVADGDPAGAGPGGPAAPGDGGDGGELPGLGLAESLRTAAFWMLALCQFSAVFGGMSLITHIPAFLTDAGFDSQLAAGALGLAIGASVGGRLLFGVLADRFPKRYVMASALVVHALAMFFLFGIHTFGALPAFVITFGVALGGAAVMIPLLVGECFGLRSFGKILGLVMVAATLGAAIGSVLTGRIFDVTGHYTIAFVLHLAVFLAGAALACFLRPPGSRPSSPGTAARVNAAPGLRRC
jgi:MFS family permease